MNKGANTGASNDVTIAVSLMSNPGHPMAYKSAIDVQWTTQ